MNRRLQSPHSYQGRAPSFFTTVGRRVTLMLSQCGQVTGESSESYQPVVHLSV